MEKINLHTLVLMVGPSGAGKSTVIEYLFDEHEVVSSDQIRAELLGDFRIQSNQEDIWAEVHRRVRQKLAFGQRVVVDATNLRFRDRKPFVDMAKLFGVELVYIVVNRPLDKKLSTGGWRLDVAGLIEKHDETFKNNLRDIMRGDGIARVIEYTEVVEIDVVQHVNDPVSDNNGWFDNGVMVVGDVHGNFDDLKPMVVDASLREQNILFLGDIVDYGDQNLAVFDLVYDLVKCGKARIIWGNHERKLTKWIDAGFGADFRGVVMAQGMGKTVNEINAAVAADPTFKERFRARWRMLHSNSRQHFVNREWLFTHGAATTSMWDMSGHSLPGFHSNMAFFGEVDEAQPMRDDGYPNRTYRWIDSIPARHTVVVGHDHRDKSQPLVVTNAMGGQAIFLDTGSSKGGKLSCMTV